MTTEAQALLTALAGILAARRRELPPELTVGVAVSGVGRFTLRPHTDARLEPWAEDANLLIYTDSKTLSDMARGALDFENPAEKQTFIVGGEDWAIAAVQRVLGRGMSLLELRGGPA